MNKEGIIICQAVAIFCLSFSSLFCYWSYDDRKTKFMDNEEWCEQSYTVRTLRRSIKYGDEMYSKTQDQVYERNSTISNQHQSLMKMDKLIRKLLNDKKELK